jgi:hypothetical protein
VEVGSGGVADITDTSAEADGAFNVASYAENGYGVHAHDGGRATLTSAAGFWARMPRRGLRHQRLRRWKGCRRKDGGIRQHGSCNGDVMTIGGGTGAAAMDGGAATIDA